MWGVGQLLTSAWGGVLCIVGMLYGFGPVATWLLLRFRVHQDAVEVPVEGVPDAVWRFFGPAAPVLESLGFEPLGCCRMSNKLGAQFVWIWVNRRLGQTASAVMVDPATSPSRIAVIWFCTREWGGREVASQAGRYASTFAPTPNSRKVAIAGDDLRELHRVHLLMEEWYLDPEAERYVPEEGAVTRFVGEEMRADLEAQRRVGYFRWAEGDVYRPTWRGAFVMTWMLLPPLRQLRLWREIREGRRVLEAARGVAVRRPRDAVVRTDSPYRAGFEVLPPG